MIKTIRPDTPPSSWLFQYYCKLQEPLRGQSVKIKSLFKPDEKTPSMRIHMYEGAYAFKDFSSGNGGSGIQLVMLLFNLNKEDAIRKAATDFKENKNSPNPIIIAPITHTESKIKVIQVQKRNWNTLDAAYWGQYFISSNALERYCVFPLEKCVFEKVINGKLSRFTMSLEKMYGYFKKDGTLYKIYTPGKKNKFLTLDHFIPGIEHLEYKAPTLIISSSLKDLLAMLGLNLDIEMIAPTAEGNIIEKRLLIAFSFQYENIYTLFDNDAAGNNAMIKYQKNYSIPSLYLPLEKDVSDSIKKYGTDFTKQEIQKLLNEYKK